MAFKVHHFLNRKHAENTHCSNILETLGLECQNPNTFIKTEEDQVFLFQSITRPVLLVILIDVEEKCSRE